MVDYYVGSLQNALDFAEKDCRGFFDRPVFRGQSNPRWPLKANIFRKNTLSSNVTLEFLSWCRDSVYFSRFDDEAILQIAQHYGLSTDLLDFTTNPLVAFFFALNTKSVETPQAAVFVVDATMLNNIETFSNEARLGRLSATIGKYKGMYREGHALGLSRIQAQDGVFVRDAHGTLERILGSEHDILGIEYEDKFHCQLNYAKLIIDRAAGDLQTLQSLGVTYKSLFPPANNLERHFERFVIGYPDREIAERLGKGIDGTFVVI